MFNSMSMVETPGVSSYDLAPRPSYGIPAGRFVSWPEGAPAQDDTPQAGAKVLIRARDPGFNGPKYYGKAHSKPDIYRVTHGIPYVRKDGHWRLRVYRERDDYAAYPRVSDVEVYVEPVEPVEDDRTYTAGEIMAAVEAVNPELGEKLVAYMDAHEPRP